MKNYELAKIPTIRECNSIATKIGALLGDQAVDLAFARAEEAEKAKQTKSFRMFRKLRSTLFIIGNMDDTIPESNEAYRTMRKLVDAFGEMEG